MNQPLPLISNSGTPPTGPTTPVGLPIDPRAYQRGLACVHCGLCLPACPTYVTNGLEADSPRGRIQLMLGLADGKIDATDSVREHLDLCLDCRGCETACPSGVVYHELIEETRARLAEGQKLTAQGRLMRWIFFHIFTHPTRLKLALLPARILQKLGIYALLRKAGIFRILPEQLGKMEQMLPATGSLWPTNPSPRPARAVAGADATAVGADAAAQPRSVALFTGCIGSVMFSRVNAQSADVLAACGADVAVPASQVCCGAIHHHNGDHASAEALARRNIDTFMPIGAKAVDFVATTVAGCGAMLREYDVLLRDDPAYAARAGEFVRRVRDITELLNDLPLPAMKNSVAETATYHDACHLAHAQRVTAAPRQLLAKIPGLTMIPLPESDLCCGAAGTYNLTQPRMSTLLADRKLSNIATTGAAVCATGNVGCAMQISSRAEARHIPLRVVHPVELLHRAIFGGDKR